METGQPISQQPPQLNNDLINDEATTQATEHNILVVEDNVEMNNYIAGLFSGVHYTDSAYNGKEGLKKLEQKKFDMVISDVMMPELNGFEMLKVIRSSESLKHLPVLMLTALREEEYKLQALSLGVDDYLLKPFSAKEVRARVSNMLARSVTRNVDEKTQLEEDFIVKVEEQNMEFIKHVEQQITAEFENEEFKIEQLAHQFNLSERHFRRIMKAITGLTPKEFQREVALQKGRELLECRKFNNLSAVAQTVGIRNTTRFSAMYEKRFGRNPRTFFTSYSI